jgi:hypothetical protein
MTTASALASRCDDRFKGNSNAVITASQWLSYLNEAYNAVNGESPLWPWLETAEQTITVPDSGTVGTANNRAASLPTDVLAINYAYNVTDDYRLIDQMGRGDFFHQDHLRSEVGQPVTYRLRGSKIELSPTPTVATSVALEVVLMPTALAAVTYTKVESTGGAAGNITATGVAVGDTIISVLAIKDSDQSFVDRTSEFSITATNTINNSGGTSTAGYHLAVTVQTLSSSSSPVWPSAYHDILVPGALSYAYLDDGNIELADAYAKRFEQKIAGMKAAVLNTRTENNQPIRDVFWS